MPYIPRHVVCVCVSQSKRENHPVPQEGGWEIEWPYIHKDMVCVCMCVCVCVYGKRENHPVPQGGVGGGFSFLPGPHAQLENHKTAGVGGGEAAGISCSHGGGGGGRGEYTMTSITYRNIRVHNRIPWGGRGRGRGGARRGRNHIYIYIYICVSIYLYIYIYFFFLHIRMHAFSAMLLS